LGREKRKSEFRARASLFLFTIRPASSQQPLPRKPVRSFDAISDH